MAVNRVLEHTDVTGDLYRVEDEDGNLLGYEVVDADGSNPLSPYESVDRPKAKQPVPVVAHGDFTRKQVVIFTALATFVSSCLAQVIGHILL